MLDYSEDSIENIHACLNCPKPYCNNCMSFIPNRIKRDAVYTDEDFDALIDPPVPPLASKPDSNYRGVYELYIDGFSDKEISEELGLALKSVGLYRLKMGLRAFKKEERTKRRIRLERFNEGTYIFPKGGDASEVHT